MIRSSTFQLVVVGLWVFFCISCLSVTLCVAQPINKDPDILPISTAPAPGVMVVRMIPSQTVDWEQRQYPTPEGIQVLMRVITDTRTDLKKRAKALEKLSTLGPWLHNTDRIPQLIALYDTSMDREEKFRLITCLARADDKRALPLIAIFLSEATDNLARFVGAYALARWNIRSGVKELNDLLDLHELHWKGKNYAKETIKVVQALNDHNGWGLPDGEIIRRVNSRSDLNQDQKRALHIVEIKKWFSENKHRFPDWKPSDPLPEVEYTSWAAVVAAERWNCDQSCASPSDFDDCITCCKAKKYCEMCCSGTYESPQRDKCMSFCERGFKP